MEGSYASPAPEVVGVEAGEDYGEDDVYVVAVAAVVVAGVEAAGKLAVHNLAGNDQRLGIAEPGNQTHIVRPHKD